MGGPAVVAGDKVVGLCAGHQVPSPVGAPVPAPPLPFSAPLTTGLATTVSIGGVPAAVEGSSGSNTPPHVGLHPSDPRMAPPTQDARITRGSASVTFDGRPAAYTGCTAIACLAVSPQVVGTGSTVLVGS